jgi:hypothetical protein
VRKAIAIIKIQAVIKVIVNQIKIAIKSIRQAI